MNTIQNKITWRTYLKRNWGLLIAGISFILFGILTDIQWFPSHPSFALYVINLLPGASLLASWYFASKFPKMRWGIITIGTLAFIGITGYALLMNVAGTAWMEATTAITDVTQYDEIRQQMGDSELIQHFPLSIPENAENVHFEYLPKFLQGGGHIQLRLRLPQSEIQDLLTEYISQAKYIYFGRDISDHANEPGGVPTTYFYTSGTDDHSFPDSYEILVLNAQPEGSPDFEWNHGYSYGVVISIVQSEIIYWTEDW